MRIKPHTLIVIADGQRSMFFRNEGADGQIRLAEVRRLSFDNAANHELGNERPGRTHDGFSSNRSAYEQTDQHEKNELDFLSKVAVAMEEELNAGSVQDLLLIAPPAALGALRNCMSKPVQEKVSLEIGKDYTNTPLPELEEILAQRPN